MRDPTSLEPKNGDFVAYVEALQADQAALLKAANSGRMSLSDMEEVLEESNEPRASATAALLESLRKRARDAVMSLPSSGSSRSSASEMSDASDDTAIRAPVTRKNPGRRNGTRSPSPFGRLIGYGELSRRSIRRTVCGPDDFRGTLSRGQRHETTVRNPGSGTA